MLFKSKIKLQTEEEIFKSFCFDGEIYVTIIVITFNQIEFIEDTIISILQQKSKYKYELLIHDDASRDGTVDVLKRYKEKYPNIIRLHLRKDNIYSQGHPFISDIVKGAKGKYIAYCEGDDFWFSNDKLNRQVEVLESGIADLVHTKCKILKDSKLIEDACPMVTGEDLSESIIKHDYTIRFPSVCARKEVLDNAHEIVNSFLPRPIRLYDLPVWYAISKFGKIHYLDNTMAVYRVVDNSVSHSLENKDKLRFSFYVNEVLISLGRYFGFNYNEKYYVLKRVLGTLKFAVFSLDIKKIILSLRMTFVLLFKL